MRISVSLRPSWSIERVVRPWSKIQQRTVVLDPFLSLLAATFFLDTNLGLEWSPKVNSFLLAGTEGKFLSSTPTVSRASSLLYSWHSYQSSSYVCALPSTGIHLTQPETSFLCQMWSSGNQPCFCCCQTGPVGYDKEQTDQTVGLLKELRKSISRSHQLCLLCPQALSLSHIKTNQAPCLRTPSPFCPFAEVSVSLLWLLFWS